jgi:hypothetical protein
MDLSCANRGFWNGANSTTGNFLAYCFNTAHSISASTCFGNVQETELDFKIFWISNAYASETIVFEWILWSFKAAALFFLCIFRLLSSLNLSCLTFFHLSHTYLRLTFILLDFQNPECPIQLVHGLSIFGRSIFMIIHFRKTKNNIIDFHREGPQSETFSYK